MSEKPYNFERFVGKYRFEKFTGTIRKKNPYPVSMKVGDVVERRPCSKAQRSALKSQMRRLIQVGKEFSIHEDSECFVIRRDR